MGRYMPLFSIEVEHGFFMDGRCQHLEFVPSPQTRQVIRNVGLLARFLENSIHVFYDRSNIEGLRLYASSAERPLSLSFKVFSRDPFFSNYTEPDIYMDNSILYFHNQEAKTEDTGRYPLPTLRPWASRIFNPSIHQCWRASWTSETRWSNPSLW